jgi:hypothetical protein
MKNENDLVFLLTMGVVILCALFLLYQAWRTRK